MPRAIGLSNSVSSHFLMTPCLVTITMNWSRLELANREEALDGFARLKVNEVREVLAFADGRRVGDLVDLQPVDAAVVGENQQVVVGGGDKEVLDEILAARSHADAAFATTRLAPVGVDRGALQITAVRDGNGHVFDGHQIFETDFAGVFDDLGAALVAVILLDFLKLFDDQVAQNFFGAQDFQIFADAALNVGQFVGDLLAAPCR